MYLDTVELFPDVNRCGVIPFMSENVDEKCEDQNQ